MHLSQMRLTAFAAAVILGLPMRAHAQRIGIIAGGTFSQLRGLDNVTAKNRNGTMFGATLTVPLGGRMAVQPELLFINKGSELDLGGAGTRDVRLDYLEIPLLLRFDRSITSVLGPHLYLGPSIGFNVGCNVTASGNGIPNTSSNCTRDNFDPKSFDWGAVIGAGVDLNLGGLGVTAGARYGIGIADISKDDKSALEQRVRNGTLTVYAGLLFGRR